MLEKLRKEEPLSKKEQTIHQQGLVSILKQLHDELDAVVFAAYGWPATLSDNELLEHLVTLNAQRAEEEANGLIRWLRPDYQSPNHASTITATQGTLIEKAKNKPRIAPKKQTWPKSMAGQAQAVRHSLATFPAPVTAQDIAALFGKRSKKRIAQINDWLNTLALLGQARQLEDGRFVAV